MSKTISDIVDKKLPFKDRAKKLEEEIKPLCEKYGVIPWALLSNSQEAIVAVPSWRDLWQKEQ